MAKWAANERNMPRQKISSECCPQTIGGHIHRTLQAGQSRRHEMNRYHGQREEMRKPQHVEIDLVDRIDQFLQPVRHILARRGKYQVSEMRNANTRYAAATTSVTRDCSTPDESLGSPERAPGTEDEQQLPGERIEIPMPARIAR